MRSPVILAAGVVCAFLIAGATNFSGLLWLAGPSSLQWLHASAVVVGSAANAAFAGAVAGLGLLRLGLALTKLHRRTRPAG
jgi:hypothetical protein